MMTEYKKNKRKKGFTLAETLLVVAIIIILTGLTSISVVKYQRDLKLVELDGIAKEIFVAAQNHISLAHGQAYLGREEKNEPTAAYFPEKEENKTTGINYFVIGDSYAPLSSPDSILSLILPANSIDETVRTGGSYIIRFQRSSGTILDVFYSEKSGKYAYTLASSDYDGLMAIRTDKDARKNYGTGKAVIGYYGGAAPREVLPEAELLPPVVSVSNGDILTAAVKNPNGTGKISKLELHVVGKESGKEKVIQLFNSADISKPEQASYSVLLDDITASGSHFAELFPAFTPGEDISLKAVLVSTDGTKQLESVVTETNSLFAYRDGAKAGISSMRHLENLDPQVSGLAGAAGSRLINAAEQTSDLSWKDFSASLTKSVYLNGSSSPVTPPGSFVPVTPDYALTYDGKTHSVSDVYAETGANAGLFGALSGGSVSDLTLINFNIKSSGANSGALAGSLTNVNVTGVLAYNDKTSAPSDDSLEINASGNAGGLVGTMNGGQITASAAAVYVSSSGSNAGGLIGSVSGAAGIKDCYSGGHTVGARFQDDLTGKGRVNVQAAAGTAGGLVGSAVNTPISYSYSTCSVLADVPGGFVGSISGGSIANCYTTGRVSAVPTTEAVGPFVGAYTGTTFSGTNYYLNNMSANIKEGTIANVTGISGKDTTQTKLILPAANRSAAYLYDPALNVDYKGKFYFPTIQQWHVNIDGNTGSLVNKSGITDFHHGDFQIPSLDSLDIALHNEDTLYLDVDLAKLETGVTEFTVTVTGSTSSKTKAFLVDVSGTTPVIKDVGTLSGSVIEWESAAASTPAVPLTKVPVTKADGHILMTFDDITTAGNHFAQLLGDAGLTPGEDISVRLATERSSWSDISGLEAVSDNSLFGKRDADETSLANIKYIRHLQNLDPAVSGVGSGITAAELINDIDWTGTEHGVSKYPSIHKVNSTVSSSVSLTGGFYGIYNPNLTSFDGNNNTLSNFAINGAPSAFSTVGAGNAGLFRKITSNMTVRDLELKDFSVSSTLGHAGVLAAEVTGSLTADTVLAHAESRTVSTSKDGASAGGLVGLFSGTKLTVNNSAASALVRSTGAAGAAGGLVGTLNGGTVAITDSYVGGHTSNGVFDTSNVANVYSSSGAAGGIIGDVAANTLNITQSFSAASVQSAASAPAGGVIGHAGANATMNKVYTIAPVYGTKYSAEAAGNANAGAFIGVIDSGVTITNTSTYYLPEVYEGSTVNIAGNTSSVSLVGVNNGTIGKIDLSYYERDNSNNKISAKLNQSTMQIISFPYDTTLSGSSALESREYPFSLWTSFAFDGTPAKGSTDGYIYGTYYGDWQPILTPATVTLKVNFMYKDPRDGNVRPIDDASLSEQKLLANQTNYLMAPLPPELTGYEFTYEWTLCDASGTPVDSGDVAFSDDSRVVTVGEAYCNADIVLLATYEKQSYSIVTFYYDPTGNNTAFEPVGNSQKVENKRYCDITTPEKNVPDFQLEGWYSNPELTAPIDFDSDSYITGDVKAYAKYVPLEYYTVTVDFMYTTASGETDHLLSVPRYRIENTSQYQIREVKGKTFDQIIYLPKVQKTDEDNIIANSLSVTDCSAEFTDETNKTAVHIVANGNASVIVEYIGQPKNINFYPYQIRYRMYNTKAAGSSAGNLIFDQNHDSYYEYNPYPGESFLAPDGFELFVDAEDIPGFSILNHNSLTVLATDDISKNTIYVDYERSKFVLSFNSDGGTYIQPKSYYYGQTIDISAKPERKGYSFNGWSMTQLKTSQPYSGTTMPSSAVNAVASWAPGQTTYTVVYWKQNVNDDRYTIDSEKTYDYEDMVQRNATVNTLVKLSDADQKKNYSGFEFNKYKSADDIAGRYAAADGSTVLNAYYDRSARVMAFSTQQENGNPVEDSSDAGVYRKNGTTYQGVYKAADGKWYYDEIKTVTKTREKTAATITAGTRYSGTVYYKNGDEYVVGYAGSGVQYYGYNSADGTYFALNQDKGYTYKYINDESSDYKGDVYYILSGSSNRTKFTGTETAVFSDPGAYFVATDGVRLTTELTKMEYRYGSSVEKPYSGTIYVATNDNSNTTSTQYYWNNGSMSRLYYKNSAWRLSNNNNGTKYNGTRYKVAPSNASSGLLGVVDGKLVDVTKETVTHSKLAYYKNNTWTEYTGTIYERIASNGTGNQTSSPQQYYWDNYWFGELYWYNGNWCTRWGAFGHYDYNKYNGERFIINPDATSNRYGVVSNKKYELSLRDFTETSYYYTDSSYTTVTWPDQTIYASSSMSDTVPADPDIEDLDANRWYTVNGNRVALTPYKVYFKYTRTDAKEHEYTKTQFYDASGNPKAEMSGGDLYGLEGGKLYKLVRSGEPVFSYRDSVITTVMEEYTVQERDPVPYTGTRYRLENAYYRGLYGQPLSMYGYKWLDGVWRYSYVGFKSYETGMTYLGQFVYPDADEDWIYLGDAGGTKKSTYYFYLQDENGNYPTSKNDADGIGYWNDLAGLNLTEKYDGYSVYGYTTGTNPNPASITKQSTGSTASSSSGVHVYFQRNSYAFTIFNTNENISISTQEVRYGASLAKYAPASAPTCSSNLASNGYEWDGKYYLDKSCTQEFSFSGGSRMPAHGMPIFVKFVRPTFDVTFTLVDPTTGSAGDAVYKAMSNVGYEFKGIEKTDSIAKYVTMDGDWTDAFTPEWAKHRFLGWYYNDGTGEKQFIAEMGITSDMTIYPKWLAEADPGKKNVKVIHAAYDETKADFTGEIFDTIIVEDQEVGSLFSAKSNEYLGYYPLNTAKYLTVRADETANVITLFYQPIAPWTYTVEYYAIYGTNTVSGTAEAIEGFETDPSAYLISSVSGNKAYNRYEVVQFKIPEAYKDYHIHHNEFVITENGEEFVGTGYDSSLLIHPGDDVGGKTGTAVVKCYIEPEYANITIPARYKIYDGKSVAESESSIENSTSLKYPDGVIVSYVSAYTYYDQDGNAIDGSELKDVGAYIMNGYLGVSITGTAEGENVETTKNFLLCKDESYDLKLVIDRRPITIESGSSKAAYDADVALKNTNITVYGPDGKPGTGFIGTDGATYQFSVEAFRLAPGTSANSFTYTLNEGTNPLNYKITTKFGTLTVE